MIPYFNSKIDPIKLHEMRLHEVCFDIGSKAFKYSYGRLPYSKFSSFSISHNDSRNKLYTISKCSGLNLAFNNVMISFDYENLDLKDYKNLLKNILNNRINMLYLVNVNAYDHKYKNIEKQVNPYLKCLNLKLQLDKFHFDQRSFQSLIVSASHVQLISFKN